MKTFTRSEIINKHGQRIYMFAKRPGNTELEKCVDFITHMHANRGGAPFQRFDTQTISGDKISIISTQGGFEVFNSLGEKVGECDNLNYAATSVQDLSDDLNDIGFTI